MNKGELIDAVAGAAGLSRADATKAVDGVLDSIQGTLANGGSVSSGWLRNLHGESTCSSHGPQSSNG